MSDSIGQGKKHEDLRRLLAENIDPIEYRNQAKAQSLSKTTNSFETVAREWFLKNKHVWTEEHAQTIISRLENNIFPWLGGMSTSSITAPMLLESLRRIEDRGSHRDCSSGQVELWPGIQVCDCNRSGRTCPERGS